MTILKPGDIATHPEHGNGTYGDANGGVIVTVRPVGDTPPSGRTAYEVHYDLDGWERVEIVRPGHVQVRVDDLDARTYPYRTLEARAIAAREAWAEQQKPAQPEEPTDFGARAILTYPSGTTIRFVRQRGGSWGSERGDILGWDALCRQGTVTLGWDD